MPSDDMPQTAGQRVDILPLGFEAMDMERIKKILEHPSSGGRSYVLLQPAADSRFDLLLVNYDNPAALREKSALLLKAPGTPVVAVSRGPLDEAPAYHLRGMLIAVKVFSLLDKIPLPSPSAPPPSASPPPDAAPAEPPKPIGEPPPAPAIEQPARIGGYRTLVVDDSVAIQKSLEMHLVALEQIGKIDFADTGESALEMARAMRYDLIFLDVMMPGIDGYETCTRLRKLPEYKKTPIIMVSGKTSPLDEVKGVIAGCTTYLTKPVQQEAFLKLSRRVLAWLENYQPSGKTAS